MKSLQGKKINILINLIENCQLQISNISEVLESGGYSSISLGDFRVAFRLCLKVSPSTKPFIWKLVLFMC